MWKSESEKYIHNKESESEWTYECCVFHSSPGNPLGCHHQVLVRSRWATVGQPDRKCGERQKVGGASCRVMLGMTAQSFWIPLGAFSTSIIWKLIVHVALSILSICKLIVIQIRLRTSAFSSTLQCIDPKPYQIGKSYFMSWLDWLKVNGFILKLNVSLQLKN